MYKVYGNNDGQRDQRKKRGQIFQTSNDILRNVDKKLSLKGLKQTIRSTWYSPFPGFLEAKVFPAP